MELKKFAHDEYKQYCLAEGSQYIVSEFALFQILNIIERHEINDVLEIGVGIGTISGTIIKYSSLTGKKVSCTGTEANSFCLSQIPLNLKKHNSSLNIFGTLEELPKNKKFDLIIIDGQEKCFDSIKERIRRHGIVLIEGDRNDQVEILRRIFPKAKYTQVISLNRNGHYSVKRTEDFQGGIKLIYTEPSFRQLLEWLKIKVETKIKFNIRRSLNG